MIFVFGSNLAGRHGGGAAFEAARYFGAVYGVGVGPTGRSYAIPTKDERIETLPLEIIRVHVDEFLEYAAGNPGTEFFVTAIGCGLAGYEPQDIAPMFVDSPVNCTLHRRLVDAIRQLKESK